MRVKCSDDANDDIMDVSEALDKAQDTSSHQPFQEFDMPATKKAAKGAEDKSTKTKKTEAKGETKAKGKFGPREVPAGFTGIAGLATELKLSPAVVRRKLRGLEIEKPADGWQWKDGSKDLAAVKKALTAPPAKAEKE